LEYLIFGVGLAVLIFGAVAFVKNRQYAKTPSAPPVGWLSLYRWRWAPALLLGVAAYYFSYSTTGQDGELYKVIGFPFVAAAFDSHGADYVGPLTVPFMLLDVFTWAVLPDLGLLIWRIAGRRRNVAIGP
jgi:hypothetical protein